MSVNTNLESLSSRRRLNAAQDDLSTAIARLSSGLRIGSARDDAAGLAISERFTSQIRGLNQAARNANEGISLMQTAEGALASVTTNLQRMRELAVQAANATNAATDRAAIQLEFGQLADEIDRIARQTAFNDTKLLDGTFSAQAVQVGADSEQKIAIDALASLRTRELGSYYGLVLPAHPIGDAGGWADTMLITVGGRTTVLLGLIHDAKAIATAVNGANVQGLTLTANATSVAAGTSAGTASASGTASLSINGVAISIAGGTGAAALSGNRAAAVAAINAQHAATGVIATDTGSGVALSAADGRNLSTVYSAGSFAGSTVSDFGLAPDAVTGATIDWNYVAPRAANDELTYVHWRSGYMPQTFSIPAPGTSLSSMTLNSSSAANAALASVDRALQTVSSARASLGAMQSRLTSAIGTLQHTEASFAAARSRILDADYAQETAVASRALILQQAGTAMVAQANQLPTRVTQLLR